MYDRARAMAGLRDEPGVAKVGPDDLEGGVAIEIPDPFVAVHQRVQNRDAAAAVQQATCQYRPDEAGAAHEKNPILRPLRDTARNRGHPATAACPVPPAFLTAR